MENNVSISEMSVEDRLKLYAEASKPKYITLSPFSDGTPFVVLMKKPSLISMMAGGKIPNSLLGVIQNMFSRGKSGGSLAAAGKMEPKEMAALFELFCEASLVEPTYQQLKDAKVQLTDAQLGEIVNFGQADVEKVSQFRK